MSTFFFCQRFYDLNNQPSFFGVHYLNNGFISHLQRISQVACTLKYFSITKLIFLLFCELSLIIEAGLLLNGRSNRLHLWHVRSLLIVYANFSWFLIIFSFNSHYFAYLALKTLFLNITYRPTFLSIIVSFSKNRANLCYSIYFIFHSRTFPLC